MPFLPGGGKQALDGGNEDEHDEGAHQVGLEDLVPHLGVLQCEMGGEEEKEGGTGDEGKMQKQSFKPNGEGPKH